MAADTTQTIDSLQVEIEATARGTASTFKQLEDNLKSLQKALNAIDFGKIKAMQKVVNATRIKPNTTGMSKAESEVKSSVEKIQRALAGLEAYANKSLGGDKSAFKSFERSSTSAQSQIDMLKKKLEQIGNVAAPTKAFEKVNKDIEETKAHLDSLKAREQEATDSGGKINLSREEWIALANEIVDTEAKLKNFNAEADRLVNENKAFYDPFKAYRDSIENAQGQLANMQNQVNEAFSNLGNVQPNTTGLDSFMTKLANDIPAGISKIQQDFAGLGAYANAALNGDKSAFTSFERRVTSIQSAIDTVVSKMTQLEGTGVSVDGLENYKSVLQSIQTQLSDTITAVRAAYGEMSKAPQPEITKDTEKAASAMKGLASTRSGIDGLSKSLGKISDRLKGIAIHGPNLKKAFMTILKYGFGVRSLYVLFRRLRKAVIESFGELQNSGAFFETTRANIEALKASLTTLKFQFGAAFEPIFNAVAPALQTLVNYLITVMNVLSAFTAKLMGKSTYSKAVANMTSLGAATGGAAKAQKELNKQLQGFDELNNLTTNNPGGGGGGGAGGSDAGAHYVEESVDSVLGDFGKQLADKIREGDWEGVGLAISDKLSEAMEGINWDRAYEKARNFGKGLADFLNGLINPRLFGNLGTTLANSINTAFEFLNSFGTTFDWTNFGTSIGTGITNFFQNADFSLWGSTVHTWIAGLLDAGISLVDNTDWALIGTKLGDFLENLNIPDLVTKLGKLAVKIAEGLGEALLNLAGSGTAGAIAASIATVLGGLVFWGKLGNLASNIGAALGITNWSGKIPKSCGANMLGEIGTQLDGGSLSLGTLTLLVGEFILVGNIASAVMEKLYLAEGDEEGAEYQKEYGGHPIKSAIEIAKSFADGTFISGVKGYTRNELFNNYEPWEYDKKGNVRSAFDTNYGQRLKEWLKNLFNIDDYGKVDTDGMEAAIGKKTGLSGKFGLASVLGNAILGKTGNAKNNPLSKALDTITKKFQTADKTQTTFYNNTQSGSKKSGETLEKSYGDASDGVVRAITNAREDSDNAWANIGSKAKSFASQFKEGFATLPTDTEKTFKSSYSKGTSQFNDLATWAIQKSNEVSSGFNNMPSNVSGKFGTAYTESTNKWSNTGTWATGVANTVKNAFNDTPSVVSGKFGTAYTDSTNKWSGIGSWAQGVVDTVKGKTNVIASNFDKTFKDAADNGKGHLDNFKKWFNDQKFEKDAKLNAITPNKSDIQSRWNEIANIWKNPEAITLKIEASGSNSFNINDVVGKLNSVIYELNSNLDTAVSSWKAAGMKIKSYSKMAYIQRRAARGGIVDMATPLIAGEAGTEAIVPLQNHTEWLGKMADMMVGEMVKPQHLNIATSIASPYNGSADSSAVAEQNSLLREQNSLLREIASKELSIGDREVFNAVRRENSNYINRTGASAFA